MRNLRFRLQIARDFGVRDPTRVRIRPVVRRAVPGRFMMNQVAYGYRLPDGRRGDCDPREARATRAMSRWVGIGPYFCG